MMKRKSKAKRPSAAKRKTIVERLQEARTAGYTEGYGVGFRAARLDFLPAGHFKEPLGKFVRSLENLKDVDPAISQIFVSNGNAHAQLLMPLNTLLSVACELRRLGYGA